MEVVYHGGRFSLRSLIFAAISLMQIFLLEKKVAVPPALPLSSLAACWLSCLSCSWSVCWVLEGAGFSGSVSAPSMDRHKHHNILLPRDSVADLAPQLKSCLFLLYPRLHSPASHEPRATACVTVGR